MADPALFLKLGAALLLLLGAARGLGGLVLLAQGPAAVDSAPVSPVVGRLLGVGLLAIAAGALAAGVGLLRGRSWAWALGLAVPVLFVLDGALNGYLLFGRPGDRGTAVNLLFGGLILGCLWAGRRAKPGPGG